MLLFSHFSLLIVRTDAEVWKRIHLIWRTVKVFVWKRKSHFAADLCVTAVSIISIELVTIKMYTMLSWLGQISFNSNCCSHNFFLSDSKSLFSYLYNDIFKKPSMAHSLILFYYPEKECRSENLHPQLSFVYWLINQILFVPIRSYFRQRTSWLIVGL